MKKRLFHGLHSAALKALAIHTILSYPKGVPQYGSMDASQRICMRLANAYWHFSSLRKKAIAVHKEACRTHARMSYGSRAAEAEIALAIALFKLRNLNDRRGAERYAAAAFDAARLHDLREILKKIELRFPELLFN